MIRLRGGRLVCLAGLMVLIGLGVGVALAQEASAPVAPDTEAAESVAAEPSAAEQTAGRAFIDKLVLGGYTVLVQVILSVAGLAFAVERFINLRRVNIVPRGLIEQADRLWHERRFDEIVELTKQSPSTLGRMIRSVVEHRRYPAADVSTIAGDIGARELRVHSQKAYPIAVVATLEPLLGLFGTVWGMIGAFDKVAMMGEMGNASALSSEISLALVTTAVGLAIAIPMLALYHYFKNRTAMYAVALEEQVGDLITRRVLRKNEPQPAASAAASPSRYGDAATPTTASIKEVPGAHPA